MSVCLLLSTAGSAKEAEKIGRILVQEKLAACVSVIPGITSYFFWEGKMNRAREALLLAKTEKEKTGEIIKKIKEMHSYEVPEIIFFQVARGEERYVRWIAQTLGKK